METETGEKDKRQEKRQREKRENSRKEKHRERQKDKGWDTPQKCASLWAGIVFSVLCIPHPSKT